MALSLVLIVRTFGKLATLGRPKDRTTAFGRTHDNSALPTGQRHCTEAARAHEAPWLEGLPQDWKLQPRRTTYAGLPAPARALVGKCKPLGQQR